MIRAGSHRVAVQPSELEPGEEQRASGLIVKQDHHDDLKRGMIVDVGRCHGCEGHEDFEVGQIVYYSHGLRITGLDIVAYEYIHAFEVDE